CSSISRASGRTSRSANSKTLSRKRRSSSDSSVSAECDGTEVSIVMLEPSQAPERAEHQIEPETEYAHAEGQSQVGAKQPVRRERTGVPAGRHHHRNYDGRPEIDVAIPVVLEHRANAD